MNVLNTTITATRKQLLIAKDELNEKVHALFAKGGTFLTLKAVTPGPNKETPIAFILLRTFDPLMRCLLPINQKVYFESKAGHTIVYHVDMDAIALKKIMMYLEDHHPLGRLVDLDVYEDHQPFSRDKSALRQCFLCDRPAHYCTRHHTHPLSDLNAFIRHQTEEWLIESLSEAAYGALLEEASLDPKFGLVTPSDSGAHKDMTIEHFQRSAQSLKPYFKKFLRAGCLLPSNLHRLRHIGVEAEAAMFEATGNINTHKGAIFIFGAFLPFFMDGILNNQPLPHIVQSMSAFVETLTKDDFKLSEQDTVTAGQHIYHHYGLKGIRGEVAKGVPSLFSWYGKQSYNHTMKLIAIMSHLDDTTIIHRHNLSVLKHVKEDMRELLVEQPFNQERFLSISKDYKQRGISPGGAADVLSLAIFLDKTRHLIQRV